jgi:hypothetical protein
MNSGEAAPELRTSIVQSPRRAHYFSAVGELCTALGGGVRAQFSNRDRISVDGSLRCLFSSWLAALRAAALYFLVVRTGKGGPGRLSTEVKRSEASHEGDKCPSRPPGQNRSRFENRACGMASLPMVSEFARVPYTARVCRK